MSDLTILALSVIGSVIAVRRFLATRQRSWLVGPVFWVALVVRHYFPSSLTTAVAASLLIAFMAARLWQAGAARRWQRKQQAALPALSKEQVAYRSTLTEQERESLAFFEMVIGQRATEEQARNYFAKPPAISDDTKSHQGNAGAEDEWHLAEVESERLSAETQPCDRPLPVRFELGSGAAFPTSDGSEGQLPPGLYEGTLEFKAPPPSSDESNDYMGAILWRFAFSAASSESWRASGALHGFVPLNLARLADQTEAPAGNGALAPVHKPPPPAVFWRDADLEIRDSFARRCLLKGLDLADDARERFRIRVGTEWVHVFTKYLGWKVDLAVSGDGRRVWVRVVGMSREIWTHDPCSEDEEEAAKATFSDLMLTRAFVYPLAVEEFLPLCFSMRHWPSLEQMHAATRENEINDSDPAARVLFSRV